MISPHKTKKFQLEPLVPSLQKTSTPHPGTSRSNGFTLLEIVIVLAVSSLIIGGAITMVVLSSAERTLRNTSGEIELLAKKARTASILHQTSYAIRFGPDYLILSPLAEADEFTRYTALGNEIGGTASDSGSGVQTLYEEIDIDPDIELSVRRWNANDFIRPTENNIPIWRFDPNGLSEPLTVRLVIGDSYAQDTYHPLTATIADSELEAR